MTEIATLSLKENIGAETSAEIIADLSGLNSVKTVRNTQRRGLDPQTAMILLDVTGGVLGAVASGWALIEQIKNKLGKRRISGARITLPNGIQIELDNLTEDRFAQLMARAPGQ